MVSYKEALNAAATAAFCAVSAPVERTVALGEDWYNNQGFPGAPSGPTPLGQGLRAARNLACNEPPDDASSGFFQPFTGGQCPGTRYSVTARPTVDGSPIADFRTRTGEGPVSYSQGARDDGGSVARISIPSDEDWFIAGAPASGGVAGWEISDVTPVDGPDDCGDAPEQPVEPYLPRNFSPTTDVTYTDDNGVDVTIPVGLVFAPVSVDVDGTVNVPVTVNATGFASFEANLDLSTGDLNLSLGVEENNFTTINDTTVINDLNGPPGDTPTDEEEIQSTIIGVYVVCTIDPSVVSATELTTATAPVGFYVPRLADVSFHCELLSVAGLGWIRDIPVKYERQFIPCPVPWGAKSVAVTAQDGVTVQVALVRAKSERDLLLSAAMV